MVCLGSRCWPVWDYPAAELSYRARVGDAPKINKSNAAKGRERIVAIVVGMLLVGLGERSPTFADLVLTGQDVLLVVNQDSPTSVYIANMYREYHPEIADNQIVYLAGIPDSSGASSTAEQELITRSDYESKIAAPIRAYLIANNLVNRTKVILTTAGLPYRIEDTIYPNLVTPAGSSVSYDPCQADAASVELELTCLFLQDPNAPPLTAGPGMTDRSTCGRIGSLTRTMPIEALRLPRFPGISSTTGTTISNTPV